MRYRRLFDLDLGGGARAEAEMDRELEEHLVLREAELVRKGMSAADARAEARRRFGDFDARRRELRAAARERESATRSRSRLADMMTDLRYAARQARRTPGFTALAVASLAIGIGATTTVFSLLEHVLLRPLPFANPQQLVAITGQDSSGGRVPTVSSADWRDWRKASSLADAALHSYEFRLGIVTGDSAYRVNYRRVSGNYFATLRPRFVAGRPFTEAEVGTGDPVVVISERLWRTAFGRDPGLGQPLRTAARSYDIVGVVADGQDHPSGTDAWIPVPMTDPTRVNINWSMIGRLRGGRSASEAATELSTIARGILAADPAALYDHGVEVQPLGTALVGDASEYLRMLMAVVACLLLIVCANVASASLARAGARAREMAVRTSLGAGRRRLVQQLLVEHLALGLFGGLAGLFVAWGALRAIIARWGGQIPRAAEVAIDARVFLFLLGASVVAGLLAGTLPAVSFSRVSLPSLLSSGGRTARGGRGLAGAALVSFEIALAVMLLTGSALLVRSFRSVLGRDIGFDTNVATAEVTLSRPAYAQDAGLRLSYWDRLIDAYRGIPGVEAVAVTNWIPLGLTGSGFIDIDGKDTPGAGAVYRTVSSDFFRALDVPLVLGRGFDARDDAGTERVVVINQTMAERYWPGESPLGRRVRARSMEPQLNGQPAPWLTVVGVVGDVRTYGLESDARAEMYANFRQTPTWTTSMVAAVRGRLPAERLAAELRARARTVDPALAIDTGTLSALLRDTLATRVLTMSLLTAFAGLALLLAAIGVYGVLAYAVAQRTREMAIRAALGATRGGLVALVLRAGLRVVIVGLAVGVVAALMLSRVVRSMLVDVAPVDPVSFAAAIAILLVAALVAIVAPATRAARLDPALALKGD